MNQFFLWVKRKDVQITAAAVACVLLCLIVCMMFTGLFPWSYNPYNSYTLQACSWLEGRLDLGRDYPHLELAIYEGKYFVSFPIFPSMFLLPFTCIWGQNVPDGWISLFFTILGVIYAMRIYHRLHGNSPRAIFWVTFLFLGTGYLYIGLTSWVWFFAQTMCFTLSLAALYYSLTGRGGLSLTAWACAVGCRPMVALYIPVLAWNLWSGWHKEHPNRNFFRFILAKLYWAIGPCLIAGTYMVLNYKRFGNPLQFGHDYLPEFTRLETGQFSLSYVLNNIYSLIRLPRWNGKSINFFNYEGFAFYIADPLLTFMILLWAYRTIRNLAGMDDLRNLHTTERVDHLIAIALLPVLILGHVFILTMHHTMGGLQWGNRYLLDTLPWAFFGMLILKPKKDEQTLYLAAPLYLFGVALSIAGTIKTYLG